MNNALSQPMPKQRRVSQTPNVATENPNAAKLLMHPHDIVMRIALQKLGTRNTLEVGVSLYRMIVRDLPRLTGNTKDEIARACMTHPQLYQPYARDLAAFVATLVRCWANVMHPVPYRFGRHLGSIEPTPFGNVRVSLPIPDAVPATQSPEEQIAADVAVGVTLTDNTDVIEESDFEKHTTRPEHRTPVVGTVIDIKPGQSMHDAIAAANGHRGYTMEVLATEADVQDAEPITNRIEPGLGMVMETWGMPPSEPSVLEVAEQHSGSLMIDGVECVVGQKVSFGIDPDTNSVTDVHVSSNLEADALYTSSTPDTAAPSTEADA